MSQSQPPGVLLLISDDWSPIAGCYGNEQISTPHIDALATRGTRFDHAFCTTPSCAASRANILTGYYSHQHGQYGHCHAIHGFRTHAWVRSVPAVLRERGVFTGLVGKSHVLPKSVYPFEVFRDERPNSNQWMAQQVGDFLAQADGRPFYLHAASTYPHRAASTDPHRLGPTFPTAIMAEEFAVNDVTYDPSTLDLPGFLPDTPQVRQDLADYYTYVSRFDAYVGSMMAVLDQSGRADNTLVILMSDHGMPFPGAKAASFEAGHHCPLIIVDPQAKKKGIGSKALVNWCDIAPTIYQAHNAAEAAPENLPGRSLLPILQDENPSGWDQTFYAHNFHEVTNYYPYRVLRGRRYKFVKNLAHQLPMPLPSDLFGSPTWTAVRDGKLTMMGQRSVQNTLHHAAEELFDLQEDPFENNNVIHEPALASIVSQMRNELTAMRQKTNDPWLMLDYQQGEVDRRPTGG